MQQGIFTPKSTRNNGIIAGERPYAALFFLSHLLSSINIKTKQRLHANMNLGIIGPYAKGAEEQRALHKWLNNSQPMAWEYQIATDLIINYSVGFEQGLYVKKPLKL